MSCRKLEDVVRRSGFIIIDTYEDEDTCRVDFRHPYIKPIPPYTYYISSAIMKKRDGSIRATVRSKVETFKELYLDYCCENGVFVCRPHVNMEEKILSVEAIFSEKPIDKLRSLLSEML